MRFPLQQQEEEQWCWAAIASSVNQYYTPEDDPLPQCQIVETLYPGTHPSINPNTFELRADLETALDAALTPLGLACDIKGPIPFEEIKTEIDNERPVCARIGWRGDPDAGHYVVIEGYKESDSQQIVFIADPSAKELYQMVYDDFKYRYKELGEWTHSYLVVKD